MSTVTSIRNAISKDAEAKVRDLGRSMGFSDTPLASEGTHQIEFRIRSTSRQEYVYISRFVAHTQGALQIVVRPEVGKWIDENLSDGSAVAMHYKSPKSAPQRVIESSQYRSFANKLTRGEHRGYGYRVLIADGFYGLRELLGLVKTAI